MAKSKIDTSLLSRIVIATSAGQLIYLTKAEATPLIEAKLIEVNTDILDPNDSTKAATRALPAAQEYVNSQSGGQAQQETVEASGSKYEIITNAQLPAARKRGNVAGAGAPTKYPFADMPVGASFFSADSEHKNGNALKALGSTVSSQNRKYAEETGEFKTVTRAVRDENNKAKMENGKKVTETVQLPVLKYNRKFTIRPVVGGQKYGEWTAPANGALIARTV